MASYATPVITPLLTLAIHSAADVATARQQAREVAAGLGFDLQQQTRLATATSEIARNAWQHAGGGQAEFYVDLEVEPMRLVVRINDHGPGMADPAQVLAKGNAGSAARRGMGLISARRLVDYFELRSAPGQGTTVTLSLRFPARAPRPSPEVLARVAASVLQGARHAGWDEMQQQNRELARALDELRLAQQALEQKSQDIELLNNELESTNRGVVALYAELEEKAEQLRQAGELKTRFFSNMSHEFRTPVNAILALSGLLLDRVDGDLTAEQAKQVAFIRQSAQELGELVNDLLDLVKVDAGHSLVRPASVQVPTLFRTLRALFRPLAVNPAVTLTIEEPAGLPELHTDETKLAQILRNFISNALKFTEQGEVRVSVGLAPGGAIAFAVTDTGIGIAPQDHERIFEEFTQLDSPVQRRVKGTGLGLALSWRLAHLLGGSISLDSDLGRGSTFTLTLPLVYGQAEAATPQPMPGRRILIVDDDEVSRYVLKGLLAGQNADISEAVNGRSGLQQAAAEQPDVIFLDLVMPDLTGLQVIEALRADPATAAIPVIIVTSQVLDGQERAALEAQAVAVLSKEITSREAAQQAIQAALQRAEASSRPAGRPENERPNDA
jgi:signal transduction histidine kinase/CheY-like chemotaxis protein